MIYYAIEEDGELIKDRLNNAPVLYETKEMAECLCLVKYQTIVKVKVESVEE